MVRVLAWVSLLACLGIPLACFWGRLSLPTYKTLLAAASLAWFVFATLAMARRGPGR